MNLQVVKGEQQMKFLCTIIFVALPWFAEKVHGDFVVSVSGRA